MYTVKEMRTIAKQSGVTAEIIRHGSGIINVWLKSEHDANVYNTMLNAHNFQLNREPMPYIGGITPSTVKFSVTGKAGA
jgi:hypothetical protein